MKTITIQKGTEQILEVDETSQSIKIIAEKNSKATILLDAKEIITKTKENAQLTIITTSSVKIHSKLIGDYSTQRIINIFKAQNEKIEINTTSEHIGKHTKSKIECRGTLKKSTANTKGLIKINQNANESDGYQKSDILLLDNESKATSIPDLEINNPDVNCSHGSTISRLDKEQIFYLQSRGLNKKESEQTIINGFFLSKLTELPKEIQKKVKEKLEIKKI